MDEGDAPPTPAPERPAFANRAGARLRRPAEEAETAPADNQDDRWGGRALTLLEEARRALVTSTRPKQVCAANQCIFMRFTPDGPLREVRYALMPTQRPNLWLWWIAVDLKRNKVMFCVNAAVELTHDGEGRHYEMRVLPELTFESVIETRHVDLHELYEGLQARILRETIPAEEVSRVLVAEVAQNLFYLDSRIVLPPMYTFNSAMFEEELRRPPVTRGRR